MKRQTDFGSVSDRACGSAVGPGGRRRQSNAIRQPERALPFAKAVFFRRRLLTAQHQRDLHSIAQSCHRPQHVVGAWLRKTDVRAVIQKLERSRLSDRLCLRIGNRKARRHIAHDDGTIDVIPLR